MPVLEVLMPRLSDTMTEGTVGRWLISPGEPVQNGDELVEIETDKVTTVVAAEMDGVLVETRVDQGATAPTGSVIAVIASEADAKRPARTESDRVDEEQAVGTPLAAEASSEQPRDPRTRAVRVSATPLARKLAARSGIPLAELQPGSGPSGRILRQDVDRALTKTLTRTEFEDADISIAPTRLQRIIADRMARAKREIPHYYLDVEVDVSELLRLQAALRDLEPPVHASLTAFLARAAALALRDVPEVNASWVENRIVRHGAVNLGIAVALDEGALMVPVLRHADAKTLAQIASEVSSLTVQTRAQKLELGDVSDATFTLSNLGMYGVDTFHAVINPPESGILAIGAVAQRAVFVADGVVPRDVMRLSLSADHRVYSGQTGARFLEAIRARLEHPLALLV
jgi:pyruvate dehydrogenase E2 component (dihydrolipoamide acetyltransferase)